jgi:hypothetical protein
MSLQSCASLLVGLLASSFAAWREHASSCYERLRSVETLLAQAACRSLARAFACWRGHLQWCQRVRALRVRVHAMRQRELLHAALHGWLLAAQEARCSVRHEQAMLRLVQRRRMQRCIAAWCAAAQAERAQRYALRCGALTSQPHGRKVVNLGAACCVTCTVAQLASPASASQHNGQSLSPCCRVQQRKAARSQRIIRLSAGFDRWRAAMVSAGSLRRQQSSVPGDDPHKMWQQRQMQRAFRHFRQSRSGLAAQRRAFLAWALAVEAQGQPPCVTMQRDQSRSCFGLAAVFQVSVMTNCMLHTQPLLCFDFIALSTCIVSTCSLRFSYTFQAFAAMTPPLASARNSFVKLVRC